MKNKIVILCLWTAIPTFLLLISGCASTGPLARQQFSLPQSQVNARGLFVENCATCHGKNGNAKTFHGWLAGAQNFTDTTWQETVSDEGIVHAIKNGPGLMPAFQKKLSDPEIAALAAYVRGFKTQ